MNYKYTSAENNVVYVIDDDGLCRSSCLASILPEGTVIEPYVPPIPTPVELLANLDADNALTQRNLREFILLAAQAFKLGQPIDIMAIPGVAKVAQVEAEAQALRAAL